MILDEFDPKKPFYALVLAYLSQVHGLIELASLGLYQRFEKLCQRPALGNLSRAELIAKYVSALGKENRKYTERVLRGGKTILLSEPVLLSETGKGIKLSSDELAETVFMEHEVTIRYFNRMSAGGLLILAWEDVKPKRLDNPIVQFLWHCRNAAAHNGAFHFKPKEPKKPAVWRTLKIVRTMQGDPLFADPPKKGFIGIGDALYLLADIEKKFY
jgi:hypothetical protein